MDLLRFAQDRALVNARVFQNLRRRSLRVDLGDFHPAHLCLFPAQRFLRVRVNQFLAQRKNVERVAHGHAAAFAAVDGDFLVALEQHLRREDHVGNVIGDFLGQVARNGHHHLIAQLAVLDRIIAFFLDLLEGVVTGLEIRRLQQFAGGRIIDFAHRRKPEDALGGAAACAFERGFLNVILKIVHGRHQQIFRTGQLAGLLGACGVAPLFTLAALARAELHPPPPGSAAVLDIGRTHSELMTFDNGAPASIRILAWGGETITRSIQEKLALSRDEAEKLKLTLDRPGVAFGPQGLLLQSAAESALAALAEGLASAPPGTKLYLTGKSARDARLAPLLAGVLGGAVSCESLEPASGAGPSAAVAGLIKSIAGNGASPPLILELRSVEREPG